MFIFSEKGCELQGHNCVFLHKKKKEKKSFSFFFFKFWQSVDAILEDVSVAETSI